MTAALVVHGFEGGFAPLLKHFLQMRAVVGTILAHGISCHGFDAADLECLPQFQTRFAEELPVLAVGYAEHERLSPIERILDHPRGIFSQQLERVTVEILQQQRATR
ncbi:MAG: hypothetical protein QOJ42_1649, partial [Acidobacteriaceae bacterium]|nr:hypothetical protein [Acidobacteriaceae bacterium]